MYFAKPLAANSRAEAVGAPAADRGGVDGAGIDGRAMEVRPVIELGIGLRKCRV